MYKYYFSFNYHIIYAFIINEEIIWLFAFYFLQTPT